MNQIELIQQKQLSNQIEQKSLQAQKLLLMQPRTAKINQNIAPIQIHYSSRSKRKYIRETCMTNTSNKDSQRNPSQSLLDLSSQTHSAFDSDNINHYAISRSPNSIIFITSLFYFSKKCYYPEQDNVLLRLLKKDFESQQKTATFITSSQKIENLKESQGHHLINNDFTSLKSIDDKQTQATVSNQFPALGQVSFKNQIKFAPFNAKNILNRLNTQKLLQKISRCLKQQKNIYSVLHQNYQIEIFLNILTRQYAINYLQGHMKKYKDDLMGNQLQILENYEIQPRNLVLTIIMDSLGIQTTFSSQMNPQRNINFEQKIGDSNNRLKLEIKSVLIDEQSCYIFSINFNDPHKNKASRLLKRQKSIDYNRPNINSLHVNSVNTWLQDKYMQPLSPRNNRNICAALSPKKKYSVPFSMKNQEIKHGISNIVPVPLQNIKKAVQNRLIKSSELSQLPKYDEYPCENNSSKMQTPAKQKNTNQGNGFTKKKSPAICSNCAENRQFCSCLSLGTNLQTGKLINNQKQCAILNISCDKKYNLLNNYRA